MAAITRIGKLSILLSAACSLYAQTAANSVRCVPSAVPTQIRGEGITETLGDVLFQCSGVASATLTGNLALFLPVNVTNRVDTNSNAADPRLLVDYGTGF